MLLCNIFEDNVTPCFMSPCRFHVVIFETLVIVCFSDRLAVLVILIHCKGRQLRIAYILLHILLYSCKYHASVVHQYISNTVVQIIGDPNVPLRLP
jgi:hypothetical protein